ncbi:hypothetical protein G6M04_03580 [Agrobacterium rhizogenes]|uniref:hypothetical protein n=1 Tax=Rhizobium rhizogenes TaxID=359 RepID=UPI001572254E|nr:hypothetical protein [Rhizobium rhizogenes]NTG46442.1 hypothetical protein [Rhizobium rhizogenes]
MTETACSCAKRCDRAGLLPSKPLAEKLRADYAAADLNVAGIDNAEPHMPQLMHVRTMEIYQRFHLKSLPLSAVRRARPRTIKKEVDRTTFLLAWAPFLKKYYKSAIYNIKIYGNEIISGYVVFLRLAFACKSSI